MKGSEQNMNILQCRKRECMKCESERQRRECKVVYVMRKVEYKM